MRGYCTGGRLLSSGCSCPFSIVHGNRPTCKVHFPSRASPSAAPSGEPGCVQVRGWLTGSCVASSLCGHAGNPLTSVYICILCFPDRGDLKPPLHRDTAGAQLWHRSRWAPLCLSPGSVCRSYLEQPPRNRGQVRLSWLPDRGHHGRRSRPLSTGGQRLNRSRALRARKGPGQPPQMAAALC